MLTATLTSKGQITIPKEVRDRLRLRSGQRIEFQFDLAGQVTMKPRTLDVRGLRGIVRPARKRAVTVREMNEAIAEGYSKA
ncbi:MAG TPA: AbrB/MazE/SpoVT family DNA-binding domain-containing protein [Bryobacteraceae bacterium]|nr:AbrB/MazE/SpoVT family DNA-binding domain-containing protein [Bryobacteraceae bacterium]